MLKYLLILLIILTAAVSTVTPSSAEQAGDGVTMLCLNAGKADTILLKTEGRFYLIDTGYRRTSDRLLSMLAHEGVTRLSGVFLTHNHKDHYGGLSDLCASGIRIDAFYASACCVDGTGSGHPMVIAAARRGRTVQFLKSGDTVRVSDHAAFAVLGPTRLNTDNENNNSLVMRLDTADGSILLTGDMKSEEEALLLSEGLLTRTDVLKVAFHGDDTATSAAFLSAVRPRVAVICTSSAEEKDTPAKDTLRRLASVGCAAYVTQDAPDAVRVVLQSGKATVTLENWEQDPPA